MSLRVGGYRFRPAPAPSLAVLAAFAVLASLGVWQLERAEYKAQVLSQYEQRQGAPLTVIQDLDYRPGQLHQQPVSLSGYADARHQLLLDNRTRQGRAGFEVLLPVRLQRDGGRGVLVNRGWLARGADRGVTPDVSIAGGVYQLSGRAVDADPGFSLGPMLEPGGGWPRIIQFIAIDEIEQLLGYPLLPVVVLADRQWALALETDWPVVTIGADRHYGYALQWFGLAAALLTIYVIASLRREPGSHS